MIGFEWTTDKFFWYLFFMYFTLLYFTFYGMMSVAVTPNHNIAAIVSSFFYLTWILFSEFIIPEDSKFRFFSYSFLQNELIIRYWEFSSLSFITENSGVVEMVHLHLPFLLDYVWVSCFTVRRHKQQAWNWGNCERICSSLLWIWSSLFGICCAHCSRICRALWVHLCLFNQEIQLPKKIKRYQNFYVYEDLWTYFTT